MLCNLGRRADPRCADPRCAAWSGRSHNGASVEPRTRVERALIVPNSSYRHRHRPSTCRARASPARGSRSPAAPFRPAFSIIRKRCGPVSSMAMRSISRIPEAVTGGTSSPPAVRYRTRLNATARRRPAGRPYSRRRGRDGPAESRYAPRCRPRCAAGRN